MIGTGGTISAEGISDTDYKEGKASIYQITKQLSNKNNSLKMIQLFNIGSQSIKDHHWFSLARQVNKILKDDSSKGIIITHGTDTMTNTAFFLNMVIKPVKPVVLVGSMKPSNSLNADGPRNLRLALQLVNNKNINNGIYIVMGNRIFSFPHVNKMNTTSISSFDGKDCGLVEKGKITNIKKSLDFPVLFPIEKMKGPQFIHHIKILSRQNEGNSDLIEYLSKENIDGIVYQGVGNGSVDKISKDLMLLRKMSKNGKIIVRTTSVLNGDVTKSSDDKKFGFIASRYLRAADSATLVKLCLENNITTPKEIQKIFDKTAIFFERE
ncbi:MAG: asparaginase [Desulfobacteraceae bacterium]|nr:asparaginase [Desulfobacteraceae bacterium]